jgi:hypothetical protein
VRFADPGMEKMRTNTGSRQEVMATEGESHEEVES